MRKIQKDKIIIEINEDTQIGNIILEKGDKIKILKEVSSRPVIQIVDHTFNGLYDLALGSFIGFLEEEVGKSKVVDFLSSWKIALDSGAFFEFDS